jgi:hypothetical protein
MTPPFSSSFSYDLHTLGWKAFQDLCIAVAEECLHRPVQIFLPSHDAGRDGAFVGRWNRGPDAGSSTIQCKFTSLAHEHLTLSILRQELKKVRVLASKNLADDYIILTNHPVSGDNELRIKAAFEAAGARRCRVFGKDWIVHQIQRSGRLRMMVPRLYGLGDLGQILDARAYEQASMILSAMGDDIKKLVVTDAHRRSVRAITQHNFVLLLGAPATGKSTIGASLAVGAADIWGSVTIRATSPEDIPDHLNPNERQFFWVDDAWGSTQYQRQTIEPWNHAFPLMQAAIKRGTQFLLTSRDYIWQAARRDLKTQALPLLSHSQVVINVQDLKPQERAQILYNHLKLGDQPVTFRTAVKHVLPQIAESQGFLPESARRFGSTFFTRHITVDEYHVIKFFEEPEHFLRDTISNLASDCKAAIALIFLAGGRIQSPVTDNQLLDTAANAFGSSRAEVRDALNALNGGLLILAHDDQGRYWSYKHPTVADAFASLVARDPELTEVYLRGARAETIMHEVVCVGVKLPGAPVSVPPELHTLLLDKIDHLVGYQLAWFLSYRADGVFAKAMLERRPDVLDRLGSFDIPIAEDTDARLLSRLHQFDLLPDHLRRNFVARVREAAVESADASALTDENLLAVLADDEVSEILDEVQINVLRRIPEHVARVRKEWDSDYPPEDHFDEFKKSIRAFAEMCSGTNYESFLQITNREIRSAIWAMEAEYEQPETSSAPTSARSHVESSLAPIFRDVDSW